MKWTRVLMLALCVGAVSCGEKPEARRPPDDETGARPAEGADKLTGETPRPGGKDAEPADVGVKDFVDYAIGKTPLEIKKRVETKVKAIESDYNRKLEEQMGE